MRWLEAESVQRFYECRGTSPKAAPDLWLFMHGQGDTHHGSYQDRAHWEAILQDARIAERAAAHAVNMARRHLVRLAWN